MSGLIKKYGEQVAKEVGTGPSYQSLGGNTFMGGVVVDQSGRPRLQPNQMIKDAQVGMMNRFFGNQAGAQDLFRPTRDLAMQQGQMAGSMLSDIGAFDPLDLAEQRYQKLQPILARDRDKQRAAAEERLFRQGRLDSGFGGDQMARMEEGFSAADAQLLDQLLGESQQMRRDEINTAMGLAEQPGKTFGALSAEMRALPGTVQSLDRGMLDMLNASGAIGDRQLARQAARSGAIRDFNKNMVAREGNGGGGGGWGSALGSIAGTAIGSTFGQPQLGGALGSMAGGGLENYFT